MAGSPMTAPTLDEWRGGYNPLPDVLIKRYGVACASVYGRIWRYAQMAKGVCTADQERIGQDLRMTRQTVNKWVKVLIRDGWIVDITPDVQNHSHALSITQKINEQEPEGASEAENGVKSFDTGVKNFDTGVKPLDTGVKPIDSGGVKTFDTKKDSLRNKLTNEGNEMWRMVASQLSMQMGKGEFARYIRNTRFHDFDGNVFALHSPDAEIGGWVESRLGKTIMRSIEPLVGHPVRLQVLCNGSADHLS